MVSLHEPGTAASGEAGRLPADLAEVIPVPGLKRSLANFTLDMVMNNYYRNLNSYACYPPLVMTLNDKSTSDVHPTGTDLDINGA